MRGRLIVRDSDGTYKLLARGNRELSLQSGTGSSGLLMQIPVLPRACIQSNSVHALGLQIRFSRTQLFGADTAFSGFRQ